MAKSQLKKKRKFRVFTFRSVALLTLNRRMISLRFGALAKRTNDDDVDILSSEI